MDAKANQAGVSIFLSSDRLASLSDTMFGVAMTLVATTLLPSIQAHRGSVLDMLPDMNGELVTVVLSFAISARYWVSQQQRLAMTNSVTPFQTWLHLAFLFLIVLVPISTSLPGLAGSGAKLGSVMIYGTHLFLIALVNLLLWIEVHRTVVAHRQIVRSSLALALFVAALGVGAVRPNLALYLWFAVLATPLLARYLTRPLYRT
ncbi:MAG: TMEM175 family protein [Acetobacteraceae bacterium]